MAQYICPGCSYTYDENTGDEHQGYPAGTAFDGLPDDFACPQCFVREKEDFELKE